MNMNSLALAIACSLYLRSDPALDRFGAYCQHRDMMEGIARWSAKA